MQRLRRSQPSPALVVAILALVAALAGSAVGQEATTSVSKKRTKQIANRQAKAQINKLAPGLSVLSAENATNAQNANSADVATAAESANSADRASSATNANAPFAYARLDGSGVVTPDVQSRNITSANVSHPAAGVYCLDLPFNPVHGQATSQAEGTLGSDDLAMIEIATGGVTLNKCPASAEVELNNYDVSDGAQVDDTMYVQLWI